MNPDLLKQLDAQYRDLQHHIDLLSKGECKAMDVKHRSALLGIYQERDGTYMCRVRRNAGQVSTKNLHDLANIMEVQQINHAHFSTRQNIQLHGVPADKVYQTIIACNDADMIFRGGGGNTFRSIATSPRSGVSPTEAFDTIPHTQAVWNWISTYERAYGFGRKFKIGISAEPTDDINAGIQDLGFVAKLQDGKRGFKVYSGGGMGRNPGLGTVLMEFLPEKEIIRVVQAMVDLFFENGNRKVRPKARLRFLFQELGPDAFSNLFFQYLEQADAPDFEFEPMDYKSQIELLKKGTVTPIAGFDAWERRSVINTAFGDDIKSAHLYVRDGNLRAEQLRSLASILNDLGIQGIRATSTQNLILPLVHSSALPELHSALKNELADVIDIDGDFTGQLVSCIGATACPIGLLKTEGTREHIANALNELLKSYPELAPSVYNSIISGINISGCASACGLNLISGIGFHGHKKRIDGEIVEFYQVHLGGEINEAQHAFGYTNTDWLVAADEVEAFVSALVQQYLKQLQSAGTQTFQQFMASKRDRLSTVTDFSMSNVIQIIQG
ncbi:nitrite/sulfite reductase [Pontiellaceae bacterium B1224]|nr:nitrite/sulfite reductase [Pontiellaceae bacterium B1224]